MIDPDERPGQEPEQGPALIDPRNIHPAPEGLFADGTETSGDEPATGQEPGDPSPGRDVRGMVDPRSEAAGPDI